MSLKKYREALEVFNSAIRANCNAVCMWYTRGLALYNLGRYDEAVQSFENATCRLDDQDHDLNTLYWKAYALYNLGSYEKALSTFNDLIYFRRTK